MSEITKKYIKALDLPRVVQGDGYYLMTQLRRYLADIAEQVNRANGFEANEEIETSGLAPPPNFSLTFSPDGGLFQWSDPSYLENLAYYEVRTNAQVGTQTGLLERTTNNYSSVMPISYFGTAYLFAVLQDGTASNGSALEYNKARPEAPEDINLSKNDQGTLINWTLTPLDCIGAHVYVNGTMYETQDNWILYTGELESIDTVIVAYYDSFGEGERGYLYCNVPVVQGFTVERNGAVLDFFWQSVGINGAGYSVRASKTGIWENGIEIFHTNLLKKKMEYPNTGDIYFLIKAYDEHGNYSPSASYYLLKTVADQQKNVIIDFDEHAGMYTGNKIGVYYDAKASGLRLSEGQFEGEYISQGHLPYSARARSWPEFDVEGVDNTDLIINELDFSLNDDKAKVTTMGGGTVSDLEGTTVSTYIATKKSSDSDFLLQAGLNGDLLTLDGDSPSVSDHCDTFTYARWLMGLQEDELTRLKYELPNETRTLAFVFSIKMARPQTIVSKVPYTIDMSRLFAIDDATAAIDDFCSENEFNYSGMEPSEVADMTGGDCFLRLYYNDGFTLEGSDGAIIHIDFMPSVSDVVTFGISQTTTTRALFIKNMNSTLKSETMHKEIEAAPVGVISSVRFYK